MERAFDWTADRRQSDHLHGARRCWQRRHRLADRNVLGTRGGYDPSGRDDHQPHIEFELYGVILTVDHLGYGV